MSNRGDRVNRIYYHPCIFFLILKTGEKKKAKNETNPFNKIKLIVD